MSCSAYCGIYYVDPNGNDSNSGTIDYPFATITKAIEMVSAGGTIYLRGGTHSYSSTISITKSGSSGNLITLQNYQNEVVIIDFSGESIGSRGISLNSANYWHLKDFTVQYAGDNGIIIQNGTYNILERIVSRYNEDSGIQLHTGAAHNLILNCDSYYNCDVSTSGENADGFAAKFSLGQGNIFRGCRSWSNADDGYDLWTSANTVTFEDCWSFRNGINHWGISGFAGDGNGFKLGMDDAPHILIRCVAYDNPHYGFDRNNNSAGSTIYNCTGVNNLGSNYRFDLSSSTFILRNNISYLGTDIIAAAVDDEYNTWNAGFSVDRSDFVSLDSNGIDGPRQSDGSLPDLYFIHLESESALVDAGIDVGLPYADSAPDLGAFEVDDDNTPPVPNPMTFATAPYAAGSNSITMVASTATDDISGVEYYFTCMTDGGHDSDWQSGTSYTDTHLAPSTLYTYTVKARDTSINHNQTTASGPASATTDADITPPMPNPIVWASLPTAISSTSIIMTAATAADDSPPVQYYFECTTNGSKSSGWQSSAAYTASGLMPSTSYSFRVKARDSATALNETSWSSVQSAMTYVAIPVAGNVTTNTLSTPRTSATFSHTVPAGGNRLLAVGIMIRGHISVSSVAYDGYELTKAVSRASGASSSCGVEIWYMVAPPIGTTEVIVNFSDTADPSAIAAVNFIGVDQNNPIGATASDLATSSTNITVDITTLNTNSLIFGAVTNYGGDTDPFTPGSDITELWDNATGTSTASDNGQWGGYRLAETAGTYTFNTTSHASDDWTIAAVEIKAAPVITLPGQASDPIPPDGAIGVSLNQDLSWTADIDAESHDVYFGTVNPPPFIGNQAGTIFDPGTMTDGKTYYWRIDEKNASGTTTGTVWSFATPADAMAPTPNPITWAVEPNAISNSTVTMTATEATDVSGVEYYFANITDPNHDSGWVANPSWTNTGLVNNTTYTYMVIVRDMSVNHNETGWSAEVSTTTLAWGCVTPIVSDLTDDCQVDFLDFADLADAWAGNLPEIDLNEDSELDLLDIAEFALDWLACNRNPSEECWQ